MGLHVGCRLAHSPVLETPEKDLNHVVSSIPYSLGYEEDPPATRAGDASPTLACRDAMRHWVSRFGFRVSGINPGIEKQTHGES